MNVSLYIMQSGDCQKVGIAGDARKRQSQMQTGNPDFVSIHVVTEPVPKSIALQLERRTHEILAGFRQRGEWFRCELWDAIDAAIQAATEYRFQIGLRSQDEIDRFFGIVRGAK